MRRKLAGEIGKACREVSTLRPQWRSEAEHSPQVGFFYVKNPPGVTKEDIGEHERERT